MLTYNACQNNLTRSSYLCHLILVVDTGLTFLNLIVFTGIKTAISVYKYQNKQISKISKSQRQEMQKTVTKTSSSKSLLK